MLVDKLKQNVEKETDKLTHVSQLRRVTDQDNYLLRNDFKKLARTWRIRLIGMQRALK
jgi:hypothetical protein